MKVKHNLWKYGIVAFTNRRNYFPILAIYFLTLPNTNAAQLGIISAIGAIISFLLEVPSGYFADSFGHRRTIILAKLSMIISVYSYMTASGFVGFLLGGSFLAIGWSLLSGTQSAFIHETLKDIGREKEFGVIFGKIHGWVSLLSAFMLAGLPFLTKIDILLPLKIWLVIDIIGFLVSLSFVKPKSYFAEKMSMWKVMKEAKKKDYYPLAIFLGFILGFLFTEAVFRSAFLEFLGLPIILVGFAEGLSRIFWFIISRNLERIQKVPFHKLLRFEMFFFPLTYILIIILANPYFAVIGIALMLGYYWGRSPIITNEILTNYNPNEKYKATLISIGEIITNSTRFIIALVLGVLMNISFRIGYLSLGIGMLILLAISYRFIKFKNI